MEWNCDETDEGALPTSKNMAQQRGKAKAPYSTRDSKSGQMDGCGGKAKNVCECDKSMQAPCDLGICALHAGASVRHQVARRRMSRLAEECRRHLGNRVQLAGRTLATQSGNYCYWLVLQKSTCVRLVRSFLLRESKSSSLGWLCVRSLSNCVCTQSSERFMQPGEARPTLASHINHNNIHTQKKRELSNLTRNST